MIDGTNDTNPMPPLSVQLENVTGQWRLCTRRDLDQSHFPTRRGTSRNAPPCTPNTNRVAIPPDALRQLHTLERHVEDLKYEHGKEGKIPRANTFRPYRLTVRGQLAAIVVVRASEAFNLCEVDVFITAGFPGVTEEESTRAALLFTFAEAIKNSASAAVQFTSKTCDTGVPPTVVTLAERSGTKLSHASAGTLSPNEVRSLYPVLLGFETSECQRLQDLSRRGILSTERTCQLVATGAWSKTEISFLLQASPHPDLTLGRDLDVTQRHLASIGVTFGRAATLLGMFDRALSYVNPASRDAVEIEERNQFYPTLIRVSPEPLGITFTTAPKATRLPDYWSHVVNAQENHDTLPELVLLRPRPLGELRILIRQDLEYAHSLLKSSNGAKSAALMYTDDFHRLTSGEQDDGKSLAKSLRVGLLVAPTSASNLDQQVWKRISIGRTIRL